MMECWVRTGDGQAWKLPTAVSWVFRYGTDTPCDSFSLRCLWERGQERVLSGAYRFYADWEGRRVFTGVVDEFAVVCGGGGLTLELEGRGMAALLLDNEAMPAEYQRCTRADLIANHVAPYGVACVGGQVLSPVAGFTVGSGESEWSVVRRFACYYGGVTPRFDREGRLVLDPYQDGQAVRIGGKDKITEWEYREDRHGVLSKVAVRRRTTWGTQWVSDHIPEMFFMRTVHLRAKKSCCTSIPRTTRLAVPGRPVPLPGPTRTSIKLTQQSSVLAGIPWLLIRSLRRSTACRLFFSPTRS